MGKKFLLIAAIGTVCVGAMYYYISQRKAKMPQQTKESETQHQDAVIEAKGKLQEEVTVMTDAKSNVAQSIIERHQQIDDSLQEMEKTQEEIIEDENTKLADQLLDQLNHMD